MEVSHRSPTILVIEDDASLQRLVVKILGREGFDPHAVSTGKQALSWLETHAPDLLLLDLKLPDTTGRELLERLDAAGKKLPFIVTTGQGDERVAVEMMKRGAIDYLVKDNAFLEFLPSVVRRSLEQLQREQRLAAAERELRFSEERFRRVVETAGCMIVILRPDHTITYFSPFAEELTGYRASEVIGKDYFAIFLAPTDREPVAEEIRRILATGQPTQRFENPIVCKDGCTRAMLWNARPILNYEGGPGIVAIGQDITELKQAHERILQTERLAAIGQAMAGLAHESRNALQRSQACLEMLAMDIADRPEALEFVTDIQKAQDYLHHLYEEVRGYAAPVNPKRESCHLGELLDEVWLQLWVARQGRAVHLHQGENGLDLHCQVDRHSIAQVFRNILENSLAACSDPVEIEAHWTEAALGDRTALCLSLRDNGPGLTPDARRKIFEPFFTTKTHGTGLGMAITKRIIEAHSGQIDVGQHSGSGTEIVLHLPRSNDYHPHS